MQVERQQLLVLIYTKILIALKGQVTSVNGFSSLQGVNPNSLTFNFGNLQILNTQATPNQVTSSFGSNGQQIPFFNLLENGQVIATSNNITLTDISPYSFVPLNTENRRCFKWN